MRSVGNKEIRNNIYASWKKLCEAQRSCKEAEQLLDISTPSEELRRLRSCIDSFSRGVDGALKAQYDLTLKYFEEPEHMDKSIDVISVTSNHQTAEFEAFGVKK